MNSTSKTALLNAKNRISYAWIIPILALIITAILLWDNTLNHGPAVDLVVTSADGIEAGKTQVKYRSVTVGRVESVEIEDDLKSVRLGIRMNPGTDDLLAEDSKFWVVKPRIATSSISGLDTLLSGSYIQISLGSSPEKAYEFLAEELPPVNPYNEPGVTVTLKTNTGSHIVEGTVVEYRGIEVGNVASSTLNTSTKEFEYKLFIRKPYDELLYANTYFWNDSGINLKLDGGGLTLNTESLISVLQGAITFDTLGYRQWGKKLNLSGSYTLYDSREDAEKGMLAQNPKYLINLGQNSGDIKEGSTIFYKGIPVGKVIRSPWFENEPDIIDPEDDIYAQISLYTYGDKNEGLTKNYFNQKLDAGEVCANAFASSIFSGNNSINMEIVGKGKCKIKEREYRGYRVIPLNTGDAGSPKAIMNEFLAEIKGMKLDKTSAELRKTLVSAQNTLDGLSKTLNQVEQKKLVHELTATVKQLEKTLKGFSEQGKIYVQASELVNQLNKAIKDISPAVKDVGQKPNSIIFSDTTGDPVPGRTQGGNR